MWLLYSIFTISCCWITYKITCNQCMQLDKTNKNGFDLYQKYINKALDEIASIKSDVNQIKKDIY